MGVKFGREYSEINNELTTAIGQLNDIYLFFEMTEQEWSGMENGERQDCLRTLADDIFYALGADPEIPLSSGTIRYDKRKHVVTVSDGDRLVTIVSLV